jgi:DNA-binding NarL/FixJ family response regulator
VEPIRILLVGMPQLMSDIVEVELEAQPDMEIVAVLDSLSSLLGVARQTRPDVLVLSVGGTSLPEECGPVFAERPELRVLGIEQEAVEASLFELRPRCVPLGAVSPADLAVAIRGAACAPARLWEVP